MNVSSKMAFQKPSENSIKKPTEKASKTKRNWEEKIMEATERGWKFQAIFIFSSEWVFGV